MAEIFDPTLFLNGEDDPPVDQSDPDAEQAKRMEQQSIASKAGYNTWADYVRSVGETRANQAETAALNLRLLKISVAKAEQGPQAAVPGISAATIAQLAQAQQQFDIGLEEDRRKFQENFDFQKAQFDQKAQADAADRAQKAEQFTAGQALSREQLDVQRGNTLLGLGSRPETLQRYLYALRGQQAPQQLGGVTPALPGYPGASAMPQTTPSPSPAALGTAGSQPPQPVPAAARASINLPNIGAPNPLTMGTPAQNAYAQQNATNQIAAGGVQPADPYASLGLGRGTLTQQSPNALANQAPGLTSVNTGGFPNKLFDMPTGVPTSWNNPLQTIRSDGYSLISRPNPLARPDLNIDPDTGEPRSAGRYAQGGVIPEPVTGIGDVSGQSYKFGEEGTEAVMSNDMLRRLMAVAGKVDFHHKGADGKSSRITMTLNGPPKLGKRDVGTQGDNEDTNLSLSDKTPPVRYGDGQGRQMMYPIQDNPQMGVPPLGKEQPWSGPMMGNLRDWKDGMKPPMMEENSYAAGGTIGYSGGKNDYNPAVFNPPNLSGIVGQGFNTPGIPLPPQVNMLTGGGQSLIPSAQTLSNALPSEVGAYSGFLTDEAGVQANDVFSLAKRLAPQVTGVRTPRYGN